MQVTKRGVFISYARKDGESFAWDLRRKLEAGAPDLGIIWQDRAQLEAGIGWWKQITDAIDASQFMLLVMSPHALLSPTVQREWRYARQQGVCVYPVKTEAPIDFMALPHWMRKVHFHELPGEWNTLVQHLRSPCQVSRVPFMAPDLPPTFIPRAAEYQRLRNQLLEIDRGSPVTITTALRGAGGFGKTTLAAALCQDEEIQATFDDGILWVTLGEKPDILAGLSTLYAALTGQRATFGTPEDGAYHLSQQLEDKNCLIVVDDVWNAAHLRPFLRGGKACARLVTTRLVEVVDTTRQVYVDEMTPREAIKMLGLAGPDTGIAHRLGNWPLLLELTRAAIGQLLAQGEALTSALAYVDQALANQGVEAFDHRNPVERNQAVGASIGVSLTLLSEDEIQRLQELAIFKDDTDIPLSAVASLWRFTPFQTKRLIGYLNDLSLVRLDRQSGVVRLHDAVRSWLAGRLLDLSSIHQRLVAGWTNRYELPDPYAWRWLGYHLTLAGEAGTFRELLLDFRWLSARLVVTDVNTIISDCDYLPLDPDIRLLQSAVRLSAHIIAIDKAQMPGQLIGRLLGTGSYALRRIMDTAMMWRGSRWLCPLTPALTGAGGALLRTFAGHNSSIRAVALTPDGQVAVSGSTDRTLKVWDVEAGVELRTLTGHADSITGVAVTDDGAFGISSCADGTLKTWNLETGKEERTLVGHKSWVRSVAMTPDGQFAVSASDDLTIKVWDVAAGVELRELVHTDTVFGVFEVYQVAISADGCRAVSIAADGSIRVWDRNTPKAYRELKSYSRAAPVISLTRDGLLVLSASEDGLLRVWDIESGRELRTVDTELYRPVALALAADNTIVAAASREGSVEVWDFQSGARLHTPGTQTPRLTALGVMANGRRAITASEDGGLRLWNLDVESAAQQLPGHGNSVRALAVTVDGRHAISGSRDLTLKVWDLPSGRETATLVGHRSDVVGVALSSDCRRAVSASLDHTLRVWDLATGNTLFILAGHTGRVTAVALSGDGRLTVYAMDDGTVGVRSTYGGNEAHSLKIGKLSICSVAVRPDGREVVCGCLDGTIGIWDINTGNQLGVLEGRHERAVNSVVITNDGDFAITASSDRTVRVWNLKEGVEVRRLVGHTAAVNQVAITPGRDLAVSASDDQSIRLWELATGTTLASFRGESAFKSCGVAPDGLIIVAGDDKGAVHFLSSRQ
jgi:WD40 repeat protein